MKLIFRVSILLLILAAFLIPISSMAADVKLTWNASVSPGISGYKVYVGKASRTYDQIIPIGNVTNYTVAGLADGTWYFSVTAFDSQGNESGFSNEVVKVIKTIAPPTGLDGVIQATTTTAFLVPIPDNKVAEVKIRYLPAPK